MVLFATFVLAYCSIVYELVLGQTLSAFLGNAVLRYSVTIGLYMFSMGIGAALVRGKVSARPLHWLQIVEIGLSLIGGFSLVLLFGIDYLKPPPIVFSFFAHFLIVIIGILTGLEVPLLIKLRQIKKATSAASVLGVDYIGAFAGTVTFAFLFYPSLGLVQTAFILAFINSCVGIILPLTSLTSGLVDRRSSLLLLVQFVICLILAFCLVEVESITETLLELYLKA
jgi:spermidine synthase